MDDFHDRGYNDCFDVGMSYDLLVNNEDIQYRRFLSDVDGDHALRSVRKSFYFFENSLVMFQNSKQSSTVTHESLARGSYLNCFLSFFMEAESYDRLLDDNGVRVRMPSFLLLQ